MELGLSSCVDGACLAVKAYIGHCRALAQEVERIFVPQIISIQKREFTCPNFLGLPDLVRQYLPPSTKLISPALDARKGRRKLAASYRGLGMEFSSASVVRRAWGRALREQEEYEFSCQNEVILNGESELNILLLGPRYLTDDNFLNADLPRKLKRLGAQVFTAAQVPEKLSLARSRLLRKRLFWTGGRRSVGALEYFLTTLDGVVSIAPFGCGAESLLGPLIQQRTRGNELARLELNFDEHTGEVGLITRLEAFCDLLERKKKG